MSRNVNTAGLDLIKEFEGLRLSAYQDQGGVWTIGYGHTGQDVHDGMIINEPMAESLLKQDIAEAELDVIELVRPHINSNQFSAVVSLVFNIGGGLFASSTLLRKLNENLIDEVDEEFPRWHKIRINGVLTPSDGLKRRRAAEAALFLKPQAAHELVPSYSCTVADPDKA